MTNFDHVIRVTLKRRGDDVPEEVISDFLSRAMAEDWGTATVATNFDNLILRRRQRRPRSPLSDVLDELIAVNPHATRADATRFIKDHRRNAYQAAPGYFGLLHPKRDGFEVYRFSALSDALTRARVRASKQKKKS